MNEYQAAGRRVLMQVKFVVIAPAGKILIGQSAAAMKRRMTQIKASVPRP